MMLQERSCDNALKAWLAIGCHANVFGSRGYSHGLIINLTMKPTKPTCCRPPHRLCFVTSEATLSQRNRM